MNTKPSHIDSLRASVELVKKEPWRKPVGLGRLLTRMVGTFGTVVSGALYSVHKWQAPSGETFEFGGIYNDDDAQPGANIRRTFALFERTPTIEYRTGKFFIDGVDRGGDLLRALIIHKAEEVLKDQGGQNEV